MPQDVKIHYTEKTLFDLIKKKYESPVFEVLSNVGNGTGGRHTNRADAIAIGTWPSRGLTVSGFEIKCSRSDWLTELKKPQKAEAFFKYCEYWWMVTAPGLIKEGELPDSWGHLEAKGTRLEIIKAAPKNENPEPPGRLFLASLVRSANAAGAVRLADQQGFSRGLEEGLKRAAQPQTGQEKVLLELSNKVDQFEKASGIDIRHGWQLEKVGRQVRDFLDMDDAVLSRFETQVQQAENVSARYRKTFEEFKEAHRGK